MFYGNAIVSKGTPLSSVWLAANLKLPLSQCKTTDVSASVKAICDENEGPKSLRFSAQLLIGVVRIYSRKAKLLLDECSATFLKLKTTFQAGNVDTEHATGKSSTLTLQNAVTEIDLIGDIPNDILRGFSLTQQAAKPLQFSESFDEDVSNSFLARDVSFNNDDSIEIARAVNYNDDLEDQTALDDLNLLDDLSVENGLAAPEPQDDVLMDFELPDIASSPDNNEPLTPSAAITNNDILEEDLNLGLLDPEFPEHQIVHAQRPKVAKSSNATASNSLLSSEPAIPDEGSTTLEESYYVDCQRNHSSIIHGPNLLPPSSIDISLSQQSKNSIQYAENIYNPPGFSRPLRNMVSPYFVLTIKDHKRPSNFAIYSRAKRARVASEQPELPDLSVDEPNLEFNDALNFDNSGILAGEDLEVQDLNFGLEEENQQIDDQSENDESEVEENDFIDSQQAAAGVSKNTVRAVVALRQSFAGSESIKFSDLPGTDTKTKSVKMFFELLVLATKDSVAVEQSVPFGDISIVEKPGLYDSSWDSLERA